MAEGQLLVSLPSPPRRNTCAAYYAITYACNERCRFCPCSQKERDGRDAIELADALDDVRQMGAGGVRQIVISGGEPTLHPQFAQIIRAAQEGGLECVVLSNAERFADAGFLRELRLSAETETLTFIVTVHSHVATEHEKANGAPGSWERTIAGLHNLLDAGASLILKHCVTRTNHRDLAKFYAWADSEFPENVAVQMCGVDYCGVPEERLSEEGLPAPELRPFLEECFDLYLARKATGNQRLLYGINLPLCSADPYYWGRHQLLRRRPAGKVYDSYRTPKTSLLAAQSNMIGPLARVCAQCKVKNVCPGTYRSAFEAFGDSMVSPFI